MADFATHRTPNVDRALLQALLGSKRTLSDQEISQLLATIKPVVRKQGKLYYIEPVDPRQESFIWSPKITSKADNLTELTKIYTLHSYVFHGSFTPSLEEVLSMIPVELLPRVKAFEITGPEDTSDLGRQWVAVNAGYHVAVATLYA